MGSLGGGLVGLVAGTLAVAAVSVFFGPWAFLATLAAGLIAGVCMRALAGPSGSKYLKGGLAALVTALAAFLGPMAALQWFRSQPIRAAESAVVEAATPAGSDDAADGAVTPVTPGETVSDERLTPVLGGGAAGGVPMRRPQNNSGSTYELVATVVGCLVAYQLGKGSDADPGDDGDPEEPSGDSEPQADGLQELAGQAEDA